VPKKGPETDAKIPADRRLQSNRSRVHGHSVNGGKICIVNIGIIVSMRRERLYIGCVLLLYLDLKTHLTESLAMRDESSL
jgi:hypothetical protein